MKTKLELDYDYFKTLFTVYFAICVAISVAVFSVLSNNSTLNTNQLFISITLLIADVIALISMIIFCNKYIQLYVKLKKNLF